MPMLTGGDRELVRTLDGWHQVFEWCLVVVIAMHVGAALVHSFYYRDGVVQRMLPGAPGKIAAGKK